MVKDPVCGMEVDDRSTPHVSTSNGVTYYFCSAADKGKFAANPEPYVKGHPGNVPIEDAPGQHDAHDHLQKQKASVAKPVHEPQGHKDHGMKEGEHHGSHEGHSIEGFRTRFWVSLVITVPILFLSPMLQHWAGLGDVLHFTGDNGRVAKWVSDELGLDEYFAEVLPDAKAAKIKEVQSRGLVVAMTGDGINDAPALAQADVGIAIGAGTDVAVEAADIILVKSDPQDVVAMISLARATYRKMVQNLAWATGYNAIAMPLAAGVLYTSGILLSPAAGAALMSLSTVVVAINARFLKLPSHI
jgi:YHS domain-containing protein